MGVCVGGGGFKAQCQRVNLLGMYTHSSTPTLESTALTGPAPRQGRTCVHHHGDSWTPQLGGYNSNSPQQQHYPRHSFRATGAARMYAAAVTAS